MKNAHQYGTIKASKGGDCMAEKKVDKRSENSGRKYDQKMKPFLVYQYLMRETDENNFATGKDIAAYLNLNFGISAQRRSIYSDIQEINKAILAFQEEITLEEAEERILDDEEEKTIRYKPKKGFYVSQRKYNEEDIRFIAECIHAAKFVDTKRADKLSEVVYSLVSEKQAERMRHHAFVKDRVKTSNTSVFYTVNTIHDAIKGSKNSILCFEYLKHTLQSLTIQCPRRDGKEYLVAPHALIIDNGNYYLLGVDQETKKIRTYRVDRMRKVKISQTFSAGAEREEIDITQYTQGHFGMFDGEKHRVTMRFSIRMLDVVVERFGTHDVIYSPSGKGFFTVTATVYVSNQFFGWLCGFGKQAKIVSPLPVKQNFKKYIADIYEWNKQ